MATGGIDSKRFPLDASVLLAWMEARRWKVLAVTLPAILLLHLVVASVTIRQSNLDWRPSDQLAEVYLANAAKSDPFPMRSDGVRHPLWAWTAGHLAGHLYVEGEEKTVFFTRGKWINTVFSLIFLAGLGIGVARWLDPLATVNLLLLSSLGIFIVRGTYFQPEPLYYIFFFLAALLAWRLLRGARYWQYAVFGVVSGLAYLAKPSLLPFVLAFAAAFGLRLLLGLWRKSADWPLARNLGGIVLAAVLFALLLIPLGRYTAEHYGKPFFSYTKHWMWMDNFKDGFRFQQAHPGYVELQKIPPGELPSASWYFQRHTAGDAFRREFDGVREVFIRFFFPEKKLTWKAFFWRSHETKWRQPLAHRGVYPIVLSGLCLALLWPVRRTILTGFREPSNLSCTAFLVMTLGIYLALYGWYFPVGHGDRFMGSLWIPFIFFLCWTVFSLRRLNARLWSDTAYLAVHALVLFFLLLQVANNFWRFSRGWYLETQN